MLSTVPVLRDDNNLQLQMEENKFPPEVNTNEQVAFLPSKAVHLINRMQKIIHENVIPIPIHVKCKIHINLSSVAV